MKRCGGALALTFAVALSAVSAQAAVPKEPAPRTVEFDAVRAPPRPYQPMQQALPPAAVVPAPSPSPTPRAPALPPAVATSAPPRPAPDASTPPAVKWTNTEGWALKQLIADQAVDFAGRSERVLSGAFVSALLQGAASLHLGAAGIRISNAVVQGNIATDSAPVPWPVALEKCTLTGGLSASETLFAGALKLTGSKVSGPVLLDAARIGGALELQDAQFSDKVSLSGIDIEGPVFLDRSSFAHGFLMKNGTVLNGVQAFDTTFSCSPHCDEPENVPTLYGSHIGGDLRLGHAHSEAGIAASRLRVDRNLVVERGSYGKIADFAAGLVGDYFVVDAPEFKAGVRIAQLRYGSISNGDAAWNATATWRDLKPLYAACDFSSDIYSRLEDFFSQSGESAIADSVFIEQKIQERRRLQPVPLLLNWVLYLTIAYGRHPALAFMWGLLFVLIGAVVFWKEGGMVEMEQGKPAATYNSFWYSLDLFLPLTRLQAADRWMPKPERSRAWVYLRVHHLLGWVLIPLGLAALSGLIK